MKKFLVLILQSMYMFRSFHIKTLFCYPFEITGKAFIPKPKVDVGVVSFVPLAIPRTKHEFHIFEKVTRHIFSFRQKYSIRGIE